MPEGPIRSKAWKKSGGSKDRENTEDRFMLKATVVGNRIWR